MAIDARDPTRLVIPVPELADVVAGAQIALLDPFLPASQVDAGVLAELADFFSELVPFPYELGEPARFPSGTAYLPPRPVDVFRRIAHGLRRTFPEVEAPADSLYGAMPHLAVPDEAVAALAGPVGVHAREAQLVAGTGDEQVVRATFPFGTSAA